MNSVFDKDEIIRFFLLQNELVKALFKAYPMAKDIEWLLDFPKNGYVHINGDIWNFSKHGKGIKFFMEGSQIGKVVDVHNNISCPEFVDTWRLSQYFLIDDENQLKELLNNMVISGELEKISDKLYRLKEIPVRTI